MRSRLAADGVTATVLRVSHGFHSPLMAPMLPAFREVAATVVRRAPQCTVVSNVTGQVAAEDFGSAEYWVQHVMAPVRFAHGVRTALAQGCTVMQEIGPHSVLCAAGRLSAEREVQWVPSLRRDRDDRRELSV